MTAPAAQAKPRAFKTAWFAKVARKARITDKDLCDALKEVQYLFAKKDRANIDDAELRAFRALAERYEALTAAQITSLLDNKDFKEICHGDQA